MQRRVIQKIRQNIPVKEQRRAMFSPSPGLSFKRECVMFPVCANLRANIWASRLSLWSAVKGGTPCRRRFKLCTWSICSLNLPIGVPSVYLKIYELERGIMLLEILFYRVFSLTWPVSMQIYWKNRKRLHEKRVELPENGFGTPTWPPFHCFGTPIWPPWRHVKTLYTYVNLSSPVSPILQYNKMPRPWRECISRALRFLWNSTSKEGYLLRPVISLYKTDLFQPIWYLLELFHAKTTEQNWRKCIRAVLKSFSYIMIQTQQRISLTSGVRQVYPRQWYMKWIQSFVLLAK